MTTRRRGLLASTEERASEAERCKDKHVSWRARAWSFLAQGLTRLLFLDLNAMFSAGQAAVLREPDVPPLAPHHDARAWTARVSESWAAEQAHARCHLRAPSLWRVAWACARTSLLLSGVLEAAGLALSFVTVACIATLVEGLSDSDHMHTHIHTHTLGRSVSAAMGLFVVSVLIAIIRYSDYALRNKAAFDLQTGLQGMLFLKTLRVPTHVRKGVLSSLASSDACALHQFVFNIHMLWSGPVNLLTCLALAASLLKGPAVVPAVVVMLVVVPLNWRASVVVTAAQTSRSWCLQERMSRVSEAVEGILMLKLLSLEHEVLSRITAHRTRELVQVRRIASCLVSLLTVAMTAPAFMALLSFAAYATLGHTLTPAVLFPVMYLFGNTTLPMSELPYVVASYTAAEQALQRIQAYMDLPETVLPCIHAPPHTRSAPSPSGLAPCVLVAGVSYSWPSFRGGVLDPDADSGAAGWLPPPVPVKLSHLRSPLSMPTSPVSSRFGRLSDKFGQHSVTSSPSQNRISSQSPSPPPRLLPPTSTSPRTVQITVADVHLSIRPGQLVAVVGAVGSGKSTLLSGLLGEAAASSPVAPARVAPMTKPAVTDISACAASVSPCSSTSSSSSAFASAPASRLPMRITSAAFTNGCCGSIKCSKTHPLSTFSCAGIAYCPQTPWLRAATVRANVLFGLPMVEDRYEDVVRACALAADFGTFPQGDLTLVGERGNTLSGGQRQRISLARATYAALSAPSSTLCLFDDPLSAVDARVGEHLFRHAIKGLLAGHTRVLVTHQLHILPLCDSIVVMEQGRITHQGTYEQLRAAGFSWASIAHAPASDLDNHSFDLAADPGAAAAHLGSGVLLPPYKPDSVTPRWTTGFRPTTGRDHAVTLADNFDAHAVDAEEAELGPVQWSPLTLNCSAIEAEGGALAAASVDTSPCVDLEAVATGRSLSQARRSPSEQPCASGVRSRMLRGAHFSPVPHQRGATSTAQRRAQLQEPCDETACGTATGKHQEFDLTDPTAGYALHRSGTPAGVFVDAAASESAPSVEGGARTAPIDMLELHTRLDAARGHGEASGGVVSPGIGTASLAHGGCSFTGVKATADEAEAEGEDEELCEGVVKLSVYTAYMSAAGGACFALLIGLLSVVYELARTGADVYIARWSEQLGVDRLDSALGPGVLASGVSSLGLHTVLLRKLLVYFGLGVLAALLLACRNIYWFAAGVSASRRLHESMLAAVLRAPLSWFNRTPQGRILNRFSKDLGVIDQGLPDILNDCCLYTCKILAVISTMLVATPPFLLLLPVLCVCYYKLAQIFRHSSRELKRIGAITESCVLGQFSETLDGLSTIRSFRCQEQELDRFVSLRNRAAAVQFVSALADCWVGQRLEALSSAVVLAVALLAIMGKHLGLEWAGGSASLSSLAVVYAIDLSNTVTWLFSALTSAEAEMSRVERVVQFATLTREAPLLAPVVTGTDTISAAVTAPASPASTTDRLQAPSTDPLHSFEDKAAGTLLGLVPAPAGWPHSGSLSFKDVTVRYRAGLDPVLTAVSFAVKEGERVGVVGRTGAGKSSLMLALFRVIEAEAGYILYDGVDISKLGLRQLRSALSIIPQTPVLFSGTIKSNLLSGSSSSHAIAPFGSSTRSSPSADDVLATVPGSLLLVSASGSVHSATVSCDGPLEVRLDHRSSCVDPPTSALPRKSTEIRLDVQLSDSISATQAEYENSRNRVLEDAKLWAALQQVGLDTHVRALPGQLDAPVLEGGQNLSNGQRQLLCLARALLRHSKVLVMDEATASCDPDTDNLIQSAVRKSFQAVTILTIAHRLNTIIDYDKVLVLDGGRVCEYGPPSALLQDATSAFSLLVDSTGTEAAAFLRAATTAAAVGQWSS